MTFTETQSSTARVEPSTAPAPDAQVRSHLVAAVVCTLVCFAPTGVAAVVQAGNVRTRLALGDLDGARRASAAARRLCWLSVSVTFGFLLMIVVGSAG
jgi:hypothetical protein